MKWNWKRIIPSKDWTGEWILLVLIAFVGVAALSIVRGNRAENRVKVCQENLTKIDGAKEQWALENNEEVGALPTVADLVWGDGSGYMKTFPSCPSGHEYRIEAVGTDPVCTSGLPRHSIEWNGCEPIFEHENLP